MRHPDWVDDQASDPPTTEAARNHRLVAAEFTVTVEGVEPAAWDHPTPCAGWLARDIVRHLVTWFPGFLAQATGLVLAPESPVPSVDDDPFGVWKAQAGAVQTILDDPVLAGRVFDFGPLGLLPLGVAIDRVYTTDVFVHRWDLARATGQDDRLDPQRCAEILAAMSPMDDALRASGHFGPRVEVPDDADAQTALLGFLGRHCGQR